MKLNDITNENCLEYELFSRRQKRLRGEVPDVYQYETIPKELRVQIFRIWEKVWGAVWENPYSGDSEGSLLGKEAFRSINDTLCEEYGVFNLTELNPDREFTYFYQAVEDFFINTEDTDKAIDVIEVSFRYIDQEIREKFYKEGSDELDDELDKIFGRRQPELPPTDELPPNAISPDEAIDRLNRRLRQHSVGYQYESGQIIRIDSQFIHSEVVKPALGFLSDSIYEGANEEFLTAHEHYRKGDYKDCLTNCLKTFESCLKTICRKRGWDYDDKRDTARNLIRIVLDNDLILGFMESHFSGLIGALESGLPTLRNRRGGHGQGPETVLVPDYIAAYALHLTASNILLLERADKDMENV